jgi:2-methylcitrate dehydratase PrpD
MKQDRDRKLTATGSGFFVSRRGLLQRASWAMAAAAFPFGKDLSAQDPEYNPALAKEPISPVMLKLSDYMSEAGKRELPGEVMEKAKHHILDTFAAMISGSELLAGRAAIRFARFYGGEKISTVVASNLLCGPIEAALTNAELAHSDETDDSHAPSGSHPGSSAVPAAMAVGEKFHISGMHFLRAVTLGYDIGTRITMALGPASFRNVKRDTHSVVAVFGSAAAAACAANLTAQQMRWVLDYTAQQASGITYLYRDTDHIEKGFVFAGMGARSGATAALLVYSGWNGIDDMFSGRDNFIMAYAPQADPAGFIDKLGERYEVTRTNIKKWTVGSPIQAALDAMENVQKQHSFEPAQVKQVVVKLAGGKGSIVDNADMPDICLQYMIAVMMIDKTASFHAAHDKARMKDPAILRERAKVDLVSDDELGRHARREAIVEVTLADGTRLSNHVDAVRGTAENPMPREEVVAKARDLITPILGSAKGAKLIDKVLALENVKDIRELRPLLQLT